MKKKTRFCKLAAVLLWTVGAIVGTRAAETSDPLLDLLIQKGMLTREEADRVKAEAEAIRTNAAAQMSQPASKWKISDPIKSVELFGDIRLRYEHRQANTPDDTRLELDRGRAALRLGLRGDAFDDFYFGLRLETSSNPRSPWVTFGSSSPGPFGKSANGVAVGQAYIGWHPVNWLDITVGKMPNPLYTTPMVWDPDLNPEGAAEHLKYSVGPADFFVNLGQFLYQDNNPTYISGSLAPSVVSATRQQDYTDQTFMLAWQAGMAYHFTKDISAKVAPVLYQYIGLVTNAPANLGSSPNGIGDAFIGEGSFGGATSPAPIQGLTTQNGIMYNQVGVNKLLVLDVPFEVNFKISKLNARVFGDYAYNFQGRDRATAAVNALATASAASLTTPPLLQYGPQRNDVHAYQGGIAFGNKDSLGLVYGTTSRKHAWEFRSYWQHIEQYALDPNLLDSDFFEGRANLEGAFFAFAYGLTDNVIGTVHYGYGWRINDKLGTGGSNLDIPQINPIDHYSLFQLDLTLRF